MVIARKLYSVNSIRLQKRVTLRESISDLHAVESHPDSIQYVADQTDDLQLLAVTNKPSSIQYIKQPTIEVQRITIEHDPDLIRFIWVNADPDIRKLAVTLEPTCIQYILDSTLEEQQIAMADFTFDDLVYIKNGGWSTFLLFVLQIPASSMLPDWNKTYGRIQINDILKRKQIENAHTS
jgi:hypothetical protein